MINDGRGLADRLRNWKEEPMCKLMRHVVNLEGWGLGNVVEPDTSV